MVTTLVEAADPEKVSAAALAAYALEASRAPAAREIALVASLAPTPLDPPEVVGVVGVLLSDDLFPAEMRLRGSDAAYVTNLAVASRARRGVASDLLGAAERFASESGRRTVWCRVDDDNHTARGMYERRGYAPRSRRDSRNTDASFHRRTASRGLCTSWISSSVRAPARSPRARPRSRR